MLSTILRRESSERRNLLRSILWVRAYSIDHDLKKTPLYDLHISNGAKMVPFAGYSMPVLYDSQTHIESHQWVRNRAGLFDVSHMCQHIFKGTDATAFLEKVTPSSLKELRPFNSTLSTLLLPTGGIVDDTIITKHSKDEYYIVTNAACREKDISFLQSEMKGFSNLSHIVLEDWGLVALQGPLSSKILQNLTSENLSELKFGKSAFVKFGDQKFHVARGGYTGEDGFEISIPERLSIHFTEKLLQSSPQDLKLIGLAARDSLRLEAGMCLYGHDIDESTTPVEGSLSWVIGKRRREEGGFNGFSTIIEQLKNGVTRRRVGFFVSGPPAREGSSVYSNDGKLLLGKITSGSPSPTLGRNIAMGYINKGYFKPGTEILIEVRGRKRPSEIAKMPFVPTNYYR
ncbi:aminomethyltransferase [Dipodascopsis uninucleata]